MYKNAYFARQIRIKTQFSINLFFYSNLGKFNKREIKKKQFSAIVVIGFVYGFKRFPFKRVTHLFLILCMSAVGTVVNKY